MQKIASLIYEASKETSNAEDCEEYLVLEELVDRATEVKPFKESLADYMCPMCGAGLNFDALNDPIERAPKFCCNCGQKFDLSKIKGGRRNNE